MINIHDASINYVLYFEKKDIFTAVVLKKFHGASNITNNESPENKDLASYIIPTNVLVLVLDRYYHLRRDKRIRFSFISDFFSNGRERVANLDGLLQKPFATILYDHTVLFTR